MQSQPAPQFGLTASLEFGFPPYRRKVASLAVIAALGGVLAYAENVALAAMARSLTSPDAPPIEALRQWSGIGVASAAFFLVLFVVFRLLSASSVTWQERQQGALELQVLRDLEQLLLLNLLRKDDHFFAGRSHGEILNRFGGDIKRVSAYRSLVLQQFRSAFLVVGNLYFFASQNWRLATLALMTLAAGAFVSHRLIRSVQKMDRSYLNADDQVKASFEDLLGAGPEVQVGNLFSRVASAFARVQEPRTKLFQRYVTLESLVSITPAVGYACALAALVLFALYWLSGGSAAAAAAMIPVILKALPELFGNAASLVTQRLVVNRAESSARRLAEYASADGATEDVGETVVVAPGELALEKVTFRYAAPDGSLQGGIVDVTAELPLGKWTAIVGPAGSGKSTLLQLLLGRNRPQSGTVRYGTQDLNALRDSARAEILALMPQKYFALDTTIEENLTFAGTRDEPLASEDLELVEKVGLGDVCRFRALEMMPKPGQLDAKAAASIVELRARIRERLSKEGVVVRPYERDAVDPLHWTLELLASGKCDRPRVLERLQRGSSRQLLARGLSAALREELARRGKSMLTEQASLLALPTYEAYERLAVRPLPEPIWQLRRASAHALRRGDSVADDLALTLVGLTSSLSELDVEPAEGQAMVADWRKRFAADVAALKKVCGDALASFDVTELNHFLSLRENLLFGFADASNQRVAQRANHLVLGLIEDAGLTEPLTRLGLSYHVGRNGSRLSGGQRQLIALCRAMVRRTPVLVLDEPTSALDPASRARVTQLLKGHREDRIVVTVSHDAELVREADHILFMVQGRLAGSGTFDELKATSEDFRLTMRA